MTLKSAIMFLVLVCKKVYIRFWISQMVPEKMAIFGAKISKFSIFRVWLAKGITFELINIIKSWYIRLFQKVLMSTNIDFQLIQSITFGWIYVWKLLFLGPKIQDGGHNLTTTWLFNFFFVNSLFWPHRIRINPNEFFAASVKKIMKKIKWYSTFTWILFKFRYSW